MVKRDGTIETFDRRKLLRAIRLACVKRSITNEEIDLLGGMVGRALREGPRQQHAAAA